MCPLNQGQRFDKQQQQLGYILKQEHLENAELHQGSTPSNIAYRYSDKKSFKKLPESRWRSESTLKWNHQILVP